jgi:hypothetical protein
MNVRHSASVHRLDLQMPAFNEDLFRHLTLQSPPLFSLDLKIPRPIILAVCLAPVSVLMWLIDLLYFTWCWHTSIWEGTQPCSVMVRCSGGVGASTLTRPPLVLKGKERTSMNQSLWHTEPEKMKKLQNLPYHVICIFHYLYNPTTCKIFS